MYYHFFFIKVLYLLRTAKSKFQWDETANKSSTYLDAYCVKLSVVNLQEKL